MALITCPQCGKQVSDKAEKCPQCGFNFAMQTTQPIENAPVSETIQHGTAKPRKKWPVFVIISLCMVVAGFVLWHFVFNNAEENKQVMAETSEAQKVQDPNAPDERYLTQDLRMWDLYGPVRGFQTTMTRIGGSSRWSEETLHYYDEEELYDNLSVNIQFDEQGHFVNTIDGWWSIQDIEKKDGDRIIVATVLIRKKEKNWHIKNGKIKWRIRNMKC